MSKTLFDKVWDAHVVRKIEGGPDVLFIDRHLVHEVTSPVAFLGLKSRGIKVLYPDRTFATADHNTPTINQHLPVADPLFGHPAQRAGAKLEGAWHQLLGPWPPKKWHCACDRSGVWHNAARRNHCLRRFAYLNTWCFWGHRFWYRYLGGRNGAGHTMHYAAETQKDAHQCYREAGHWRYAIGRCLFYYFAVDHIRRNRLLC